jgi:hypothetical protein
MRIVFLFPDGCFCLLICCVVLVDFKMLYDAAQQQLISSDVHMSEGKQCEETRKLPSRRYLSDQEASPSRLLLTGCSVT